MKTIIETTKDGSNTLFVPELNEHYHSTHGAIQESSHIYINAGLNYCDKQTVNLLEIGFGTGLNAFMTLLDSEKKNRKVNYTSFELYPLQVINAEKLNYSSILAPTQNEVFISLHTSPWNTPTEITPDFTLNKLLIDVQELPDFRPHQTFDVIYYDAFAPEKQPEMWTQEIFNTLYSFSNCGAVLTTYCAKGAVRRMLQASGFFLERLPGPPGKREIIRAVK
ncbi:MAG: tRNA (5-methylaminomethyl-2-thiouridine)(34)-methyltransferase MnmD [Proteiniphilum sp.]|nr:tRNA (5-methylaminomethyl-2-thiouridine)(34)-methyltransferase MnmD [Proteiniphilum sp.]MDD3909096.1 tRNA (5-methylaminomethyl-2-thiouridine)(34)-methyltransferase MnmD [Proteiniphilum sp.]MDD4416831.1 tRNA (5-methylaminomethyl-2-thiouridine)(34)-methyltransferase MnmD [Proteiniphilum sp.]